MTTRQHTAPAVSSPPVPEPSLAERARTLVSVGRIGSLGTHSRKLPGFPFGSIMPYASDAMGRPVFFISSMAMHTQNLQADPHASLLITEPDATGDALGAARVTLLGPVLKANAAEVKELYLSRYETARYWQDFTDFSYSRMDVTGIYFIGGFGVMGWVSAEDYRNAAPDPLADIAGGIIQHMNADHAEALRMIAGSAGDDAIDTAAMTSIDRLGFHVKLTSGERVHSRRVAFPREVTNSDAAREVMIEMAQKARSRASSE